LGDADGFGVLIKFSAGSGLLSLVLGNSGGESSLDV